MTIKEALDELRELRNHELNLNYDDFFRKQEAIDLAITTLERDRWISVEERLPENTEPVLARFDDVYLIAIYGNLIWSDVMTRSLFYPTHWRPLPEPPKESKT